MSAKSTDNKSPGAGLSGRPDRAGAAEAKGDAPKVGQANAEQRAEQKAEQDVAVMCGISDDGQGIDIIRKRGERIETGTVRRLEQGKPIHGEVVRLRPREHSPLVCDVEIEVPAPAQVAPAMTSGPAQVATETYRKNWDAIYGRTSKPRSMLN